MKLLIFFLIIPVQLVWQLHDGHGFDSREKNSKFFYSTKWKFGFVRHKNKKNFWIWTSRIKVMNYYIYNKFRKLRHCTTYNKCYYWWKIMFISKKKKIHWHINIYMTFQTRSDGIVVRVSGQFRRTLYDGCYGT